MYFPVVLFVYSRVEHTRRTIQSLSECYGSDKTDLIIFSDGPKGKENQRDVDDVRNFLLTIKGFKSIKIHCQENNLGLGGSIIRGVTHVLKEYEAVVIIEDDLVFHPSFILIINLMLRQYKTSPEVGSVTGYALPINLPNFYKYDFYCSLRHSSWGWGTWRRVWANIDWEISDYGDFIISPNRIKRFNRAGPDLTRMLKQQFEGKIDSWSIRFDYNMSKWGLISVCPTLNLVQNTGCDGSGTHCGSAEFFYNKFPTLTLNKLDRFPENFSINREIERNTYSFFKNSIFKRALLKFNYLRLKIIKFI